MEEMAQSELDALDVEDAFQKAAAVAGEAQRKMLQEKLKK